MSAQADSSPGSSTDLASKHRVSRDMLDSVVQLVIGPKKEVFYMHKGLLCSVAALEGGFKEAQEQKIEMPEEDPAVFKRFQLWLYTGSVIDISAHEEDRPDWRSVISIYIFAERRGIPALQNLVIDTLIDLRYKRNEIPGRNIDQIYSGTMANDPLRRLVVRLMTESHIDLKRLDWISCLDSCPAEFFRDVILAQHNQLAANGRRYTDFRKCQNDFHVPVKT